MQRVRIALVLICLVTGVEIAGAQQSIDLASISGRVTDASGGAIAGADVMARQVDTNLVTASTTDVNGRFHLPFLKVGRYEVTARRAGFQDASRQLTLNGGAAFDLTIQLSVSGLTTGVTVTATPAVIETARSQIAGTVTQTEIQNLPIKGRNFLELALLIPGVSPTNTGSTQLFPETSAVPGVSLSVSSQRNLSNNFVVDGLSANDDAAALSGTMFAVDALDQFQVVTSGGQAELGRALGGFVNIVTRSGTNTRLGTLYVFGRHDALNAANPLTGTTLPMHEGHFGGSIGGPVVRDRTFYFANVEAQRLSQSGLVTIAPISVAAINARLDAVGYQGPRISTGTYVNPVDATNVLAKVNHGLTPGNQLTVRYTLYGVTSRNARGAGGLSAASAASGLDNRDQSLAGANTVVLSANTVLDVRGQFVRSVLDAPPADPLGPAVAIAGVATFGTLSTSPTARDNTLLQATGNVSHRAGAHAIRAGIDVLQNRDRITFPRAVRGSYTFSSLNSFLAGSYNNAGFTQTFGATDVEQTNPNIGSYIQDEWHARPGLTVNLGLRHDVQFLETIHADTNNLSPRIGIALALGSAQQTVVRGSAGLFFDRVPLRAVANALLSAGNTTDVTGLRQTTVSLSPAQSGAPVFPDILPAAVLANTPINLTTIDQDLASAYSRQAAIEVERQVGTGATVSVGYLYVRGVGLLMSINQNVPACVASGNNNGCRPHSAYGNNSQYSAAGSSSYHGVQVSFVQRPWQWGHYRVSYTWSKALNNVGEFFFSSPIDPFDLAKDWGRSDDDQRHRLVIAGALNSPRQPAATVWQAITRGFQISGVLQAYSALPFNITSGVTTIQGTAGRPVVDGNFIPRNAGQGTPFVSLNLRVSRTFELGDRRSVEALIEGFNVTNHVNVVTRNATFGTGAYPISPAPAFGQVTGTGEPRGFQLGARLRF